MHLRLNQLKQKPDIIGVVEVKPKNYKELPQSSEYNLEDYDVHCLNTDCTYGRGIILYTAPWLKASCYTLHPRDSDVLESLWITVSLREKDRLLIGSMYRSPNSSAANDEQLNKQIKSVCTSAEASHILLMGDFNYPNIPDIDWELGSCPTTLSENLFVKTVNVRRNYSKGDYCKLRKELNIDWDALLDPLQNDANSQFKVFHEVQQQACEMHTLCFSKHYSSQTPTSHG